MNIDLLKTSGSVQNKLLHILEDASLTQVIMHYTYKSVFLF